MNERWDTALTAAGELIVPTCSVNTRLDVAQGVR